jgi:STE24 endopeptidase
MTASSENLRSRRWQRVAISVPTTVTSALVLVVCAGPWACVVVLVWIGCAPLWTTSAGEKLAVRLALGYRTLDDRSRRVLMPATTSACLLAGVDPARIALYSRPRVAEPNAFASGRRSIAVTPRLVDMLEDGRLTHAHGIAILTHEIAHLREDRWRLPTAWLTAPWHAALQAARGVIRGILRHVPTTRSSVLVAAPIVLIVTTVDATRRHQWASLATLVAVVLATVVVPALGAASSRATEAAADAFVARCGLGADLADALALIAPQYRDHAGLNATHPAAATRIKRLRQSRTGCPSSRRCRDHLPDEPSTRAHRGRHRERGNPCPQSRHPAG